MMSKTFLANLPLTISALVLVGLLAISYLRPAWYERSLAAFALALFAAFLAVFAIWVEGFDIKIVLLLTVGLAAYDFWRANLRTNRRNKKS